MVGYRSASPRLWCDQKSTTYTWMPPFHTLYLIEINLLCIIIEEILWSRIDTYTPSIRYLFVLHTAINFWSEKNFNHMKKYLSSSVLILFKCMKTVHWWINIRLQQEVFFAYQQTSQQNSLNNTFFTKRNISPKQKYLTFGLNRSWKSFLFIHRQSSNTDYRSKLKI